MKFATLTTALAVATTVAASATHISSAPYRIRNTPLAQSQFDTTPLSKDGVHHYTLNVPLTYDSSSSSPVTFDVRYHVDDSHFDKTNEAPIMIQMGGEGTADSVNCNSDMVANNAICVQIEHRFYGSSLPSLKDGGGSNKNMALGLSVEANALDTVAVLEAVQKLYPVEGGGKRVVMNFGGSYSGATATWFRMTYPDSTAGAISSSGVVNAIYNFVEFDNVVAEAINTPDQWCADRVSHISKAIDERFDQGVDSANDVKLTFNSSNLVGTLHGNADFMYLVADGFSMIDQYGGKKELCDGLRQVQDFESDDKKIANMAAILSKHFGEAYGQDCYYDSECLKIENNKHPAPGLMGAQNSRSWRWQKCSQVAYLQAQPEGFALRSKRLTLEALESQCEYVYGQVPARDGGNEELNAKWGADRPDSKGATNVFSISYSDDPWKAASVTSHEMGETMSYCYTECDGCGHCGSGVKGDDAAVCGNPQSEFVNEVLAEARFEGTYSDPNHPGCDRSVDVRVGAGKIGVSGFDLDEAGSKVSWGPLEATVEGTTIVVDFSPKGGPSYLTGKWDAAKRSIVWADGNAWPMK